MTDRATAVGRFALAVDDLLTHPDGARIVKQLSATAPGWFTDQATAAGAEIDRKLHHAAQTGGGTLHGAPAAQYPAWVRLGAIATLAGWLAGEGSTCMHSPHPTRPQPLTAAAWRPGIIVCDQCTHLLELPRNSPADRTCDGCGHLTTGVARGDGIWVAIVQIGLLTYLIGCCGHCRYWPDEAGEAAARP